MSLITSRQAHAVRQALAEIPSYRGLDPEASLDFFLRMYVIPAQKYLDGSRSLLLDCGCGMAFLSHAYVLAGGRHAIAVDVSKRRVQVAEEIGRALGIRRRVDYLRGSIADLPCGDKSVDLFASIETLEHLGKRRYDAVAEISRVTRSVVVLTTPNLWSPIVSHDTGLPLAHWMPVWLRRQYASLFGRQSWNSNNMFVSPRKLNHILCDFWRISRVLTFDTFDEWVNVHPYYLPYGGDRRSGGKGVTIVLKGGRKGSLKYYYMYLLSLAGPFTPYLSHNLAGIYVRRT